MPHDLALDEAEVADLLPPDRMTTALRRQARGWPAVLGLAAYARRTDVPTTVESLSAALYEFLAEELFDNATVEVRRGLTALAVLPPLSLDELVQFAEVGEIGRQLSPSGLAYESEGLIEVHPLAREFLLTKLRERVDSDLLVRRAFEYALEDKELRPRVRTRIGSSVLTSFLKISSQLRTRHSLRQDESRLSLNLAVTRRLGNSYETVSRI